MAILFTFRIFARNLQRGSRPRIFTYIHTQLVITTLLSGLRPSFSYHLHMLCAFILYLNGGTYTLKSTPNDRFFEKLFMATLFTSQSFCQESPERKSPKKYFLYFVLCLAWGSNPGFMPNKPIH